MLIEGTLVTTKVILPDMCRYGISKRTPGKVMEVRESWKPQPYRVEFEGGPTGGYWMSEIELEVQRVKQS